MAVHINTCTEYVDLVSILSRLHPLRPPSSENYVLELNTWSKLVIKFYYAYYTHIQPITVIRLRKHRSYRS